MKRFGVIQLTVPVAVALYLIVLLLYWIFLVFWTVSSSVIYIWEQPRAWQGYVYLAISLAVSGFFYWAWRRRRNQWLYVTEDIKPMRRIILRWQWPSEGKPTPYRVLHPGWVLYLPLFWKKEGEISKEPTVFDHGKDEVNSIDAQPLKVDYRLTVWVGNKKMDTAETDENNQEVISFFQNIRDTNRIGNFVKPYLHSVLDRITSYRDEKDELGNRKWKCTAEGLAATSKEERERMSEEASVMLTDALKNAGFGLVAEVAVQEFILPSELQRYITSKVAAEYESAELERQAKGGAAAMSVRLDALARSLKALVDLGVNPTLITAIEDLGTQGMHFVRMLREKEMKRVPERSESSGEGSEEGSESSKKKE